MSEINIGLEDRIEIVKALAYGKKAEEIAEKMELQVEVIRDIEKEEGENIDIRRSEAEVFGND
ncbi:MAG: hypothetical protein PHX08_01900 [Lachnospiraceae bacterium]|nr:hypothetical protein [Lachnospiraceae bacterium]